MRMCPWDDPIVQVFEMLAKMSYFCADSPFPLEAHRVHFSLVKVFIPPVLWETCELMAGKLLLSWSSGYTNKGTEALKIPLQPIHEVWD